MNSSILLTFRKPNAGRAGFSLLEVIISLAILLGSSILLVQLAGIGMRLATKSDEATTRIILAHNRLQEMLAGIAPWEEVQGEPLTTAPGYLYWVEVEELDFPDLVKVSVSVDQADAAAPQARDRQPSPRAFRLVRWVRQPSASASSGPVDSLRDGIPSS